jgi:general secretion pathway protein D
MALATALLCVLMPVVMAPSAVAAARSADPEGKSAARDAADYTFVFSDADISQVAQEILGAALQVPYTIDPEVTGKMSFRIDRRLTKAQLLEAFEAALETNEVAMVRQGDLLVLKPRAKAKGSATLRALGEGVHGAGYQTMAVPLSYALPSEVAKALQSVGSSDVVVFTDDKQGLLILGGTSAELTSALQAVRMFDRSGLEESKIRFFELEQAPALTVASDLQHILQTSGISGVNIIALKRLNGLFVFAQTDKAIDRIGEWVAKLDIPSKEKIESLWVYHPRNVTAQSLADTLNSVINGGAINQQTTVAPRNGAGPTSATTQPVTSVQSSSFSSTSTEEDAVRVGVDKETNVLLVSTSASRWVQIQKILNQIDTPPNQVLIEASILEVTLTNQNNFGIDWSTLSDGGRLSAGAIGSSSGAVAASFPGFSVSYIGKNIQAAVNALASQSAVEVISAPKIVVVDNQTAKVDVGDQVPVVTQSGQSTSAPGSPVLNSISYLNTGIILNVTPRIGGDDRIFLDVDQEVSSASETTTSGIDSPTIQQRTLKTTLILDNGTVAALGGLISSNKTKNATGIPYFQNLPGIGSLFKTTQNKVDRDELIVLITATIVRDKGSSQRALNDLLADMREMQTRGMTKP